jgi:hypothetical protein
MKDDVMNEIRVSNWNELNDALFANSWSESLGRFRSSYAFRGLADAADDLRTGLTRLGAPGTELERHIIRNFRKYAHEAVSTDTIWNWLAVAQHHGLPTRLLDWTYSPYVALHFVTEPVEDFSKDGVVWCVDYFRTNAFLPARLKALLEEEGSHVFTVDMLDQVAMSLEEFDRLSVTEYVAFLEPPSLDARIVNQFALFSLLSHADTRLDTWLKQHPEVYQRIMIPASLKREIRDKLDQANITERVLYPGLDGLTRWLKRYYAVQS